MATLVLKLGGRELQRLVITQTKTFIGRDPGCDLVIDNDGISRNHARVDLVDGDFVLQDQASTNGIFVGSQRVTRLQLKHGTTVGLSKFELLFLQTGGPKPADLRASDGPRRLSNTCTPTADLEEAYVRQLQLKSAQRHQVPVGDAQRSVTRRFTPKPPPSNGKRVAVAAGVVGVLAALAYVISRVL